MGIRLIYLNLVECDGSRKSSVLIGMVLAAKRFQEIATPYRPYQKPPQVGRQSIPRRVREVCRRNSSNCLRTFGRWSPHVNASFHGGHRPGGSDCLTKTQGSAKSASRRRIGSDACPVPEGYEEECKLRNEALVNGGRIFY